MAVRFLQQKPYFALYAPLIVWMAVIYYFSSVPGSGAVYEMPRTLFLERKGAHVSEYCILTLLWIRFFTFYLPKNKMRALSLATFLSVSYAISDEIHQLFVFARTGKFTDVLIDSIGIVVGIILFFVFSKTLLPHCKWFYPKLVSKRLPRPAKKSTIKKKKSATKKVARKKIV